MKFLHTADLHLDSPFCALGAESAEQRRERQRSVLKKIFKLAFDEKCQMILIAGDLFDGSFVSDSTARCFFTLTEEIGVPVVVAPGNHDPFTRSGIYARKDIPSNLYAFSSSELQVFSFPELDTEILGYAFTSAVISESPLSDSGTIERTHKNRLLLAHGDFGAPISRYSPITASDIERLEVSYAALGHIHQRSEQLTEGGVPVVYCGFAEGRSFDEEGEGGAYIVELSEGKADYKWHKLSDVIYVSETLDISEAKDGDGVIDLIKKAVSLDQYKNRAHVRLTLVGACDPDELYSIDSLAESLKGELLSLDIRNETIPALDASYLERDQTIRGELYRSLLPKLTSSDPNQRRLATRALSIGLAAIDGRSVFGRN